MRIVRPEQRGELKDSQKVKRQAAARLVMVRKSRELPGIGK